MPGRTYHANPKHLLPPWTRAFLQVWRLSQGGMGAGHLPEGPVTLDNCPLNIEAFAVLNAADADLNDRSGDRVSRADVAEVRASIARAKALYPDGPPTGKVRDAVERLWGKAA